MKNILSLLIILIICSTVFPQTKYMVYFKDKGISSNQKLMKTSALYETAAKELSPRAIERRKKVMGEDFITYDDLPLNSSYVNKVEELGVKIANKLKWFNAVSCYLTGEQYSKMIQLPFIKKIENIKTFTSNKPVEQLEEPASVIQVLKKTTSLDYGSSLAQNALSEIPAVHDLGIDGSGVIIGILDSGFRWKTLPSLQSKTVIAEHDFINNDDITANEGNDAADQDNHGTAVFSIMAGYAPGNLIGPAYGASFILSKTEYVPTETNIEEDNYAAALEWMESLGVDITSSSLGYREFDTGQHSYSYQDMNGKTAISTIAANLAFDRGVSTFTAAGNEGTDLISAPGDAFNIITVGAVNNLNALAGFSSRGPSSDGRIKPEITAMGVADFHAIAGKNSYISGNGTSYATPIAAGIAGLLKSAWPHLTNMQIRKIFLESCDNSASPNNEVGYGLISAKRAVCYPNLEAEGANFILHKIFINDAGIQPATVTLNYEIANAGFLPIPMIFDGNFKYNYSFTDAAAGQQVEFYFTYLNNSGTPVREPEGNENYKFSYGSNQVSLFTNVNDITKELPSEYKLEQNYPNPFNPVTTIRYSIQGNVETTRGGVSAKLIVYDVLGREIITLVNEAKAPGNYSVKFDGTFLTSGIYFYVLNAGQTILTKKMLLLK